MPNTVTTDHDCGSRQVWRFYDRRVYDCMRYSTFLLSLDGGQYGVLPVDLLRRDGNGAGDTGDFTLQLGRYESWVIVICLDHPLPLLHMLNTNIPPERHRKRGEVASPTTSRVCTSHGVEMDSIKGVVCSRHRMLTMDCQIIALRIDRSTGSMIEPRRSRLPLAAIYVSSNL